MASITRPCVYVATIVEGISKAVRSVLAHVEVKELQLTSTESLSEKDLKDVQQNAEVLFADLPVIADVLYTSKKLKWAQSTWAGADSLVRKADPQKPTPEVTITRSGHGFGKAMAEYVLGYILSIERGLLQMLEEQRQRVWYQMKYKDPRSLSELRLGILGAGDIGTEIGKACKALGMEVWGLTRTPKATTSGQMVLDAYKTIEQLPELLENCDYICSVLPDTTKTTDLLSGDVLSRCKQRRPVFINVGRGNVIDEESIVEAVTNGWIRGAVLDVFRTEPLPEDSKLWSLPNVYITPHMSGPCKPVELAETFAKNYEKYINGEPLNYVVNWNEGY